MIIKRQYEILGILVQRDPKAKEIIYRILAGMENELLEQVLSPFAQITLYNADLSCGIPGYLFQEILKEMNHLDKVEPYDNGLTYRNVSFIAFEPSRKGNAIRIIMKNSYIEQPERIVKVISIDDEKVIDDWGYRKPYVE